LKQHQVYISKIFTALENFYDDADISGSWKNIRRDYLNFSRHDSWFDKGVHQQEVDLNCSGCRIMPYLSGFMSLAEAHLSDARISVTFFTFCSARLVLGFDARGAS
jgi:hypothetical protein